jgi:hypothetical protein
MTHMVMLLNGFGDAAMLLLLLLLLLLLDCTLLRISLLASSTASVASVTDDDDKRLLALALLLLLLPRTTIASGDLQYGYYFVKTKTKTKTLPKNAPDFGPPATAAFLARQNRQRLGRRWRLSLLLVLLWLLSFVGG